MMTRTLAAGGLMPRRPKQPQSKNTTTPGSTSATGTKGPDSSSPLTSLPNCLVSSEGGSDALGAAEPLPNAINAHAAGLACRRSPGGWKLRRDLLHDATRANVGNGGHSDNLWEFQRVEREAEGSPGTFGRVTVTPMRERQSPTDLDRWREVGIERRDSQADESDERCARYDLHSPHAEPMLRPVVTH